MLFMLRVFKNVNMCAELYLIISFAGYGFAGIAIDIMIRLSFTLPPITR